MSTVSALMFTLRRDAEDFCVVVIITTPVLQPNELNEKREKTRAYYGYILLLALVMIYGFSMTIYSLDLTSTAARMDHLMTTIVTSIQTLVASVIGFYFGSERK
jgi:hypothetical protein